MIKDGPIPLVVELDEFGAAIGTDGLHEAQ